MNAAPIQLDAVPITRNSPDDDLIAVRVRVTGLIAPGNTHFTITPAEARALAEALEVIG